MDSGRKTRVATSTNPSGSFVWQTVMMGPIQNPVHQLNYPHMKVTSIRIVSAACTTLGIASIGVQVIINQRCNGFESVSHRYDFRHFYLIPIKDSNPGDLSHLVIQLRRI